MFTVEKRYVFVLDLTSIYLYTKRIVVESEECKRAKTLFLSKMEFITFGKRNDLYFDIYLKEMDSTHCGQLSHFLDVSFYVILLSR